MNHIDKPWGWYKDLERHHNVVIKKIYVKPFKRISLQKHAYRDEFWYILSGSGEVIVGNENLLANPGVSFIIGRGEIHRITANSDGITFLEVQEGECREDDIVRLEDDYNRVTDGL